MKINTDNYGQLLLIAVIILVTAMILIMASTSIYIYMNKQEVGLSNMVSECRDIENVFGYALADKFSEGYNNTTNELKNITIRRCFNETVYNISIILLHHNLFFDAKLISIHNMTYNVTNQFIALNITFIFRERNMDISSNIVYFEFRKIGDRFVYIK